VPKTIEAFVYDLFSLARRVGCLRSALTALQRLADKLNTLDWQAILNRAIAEDPIAWRSVRDLLIRTPLLSYLQKIDLLGAHEEVWLGAEEETGFQLGVGWLTRWALDEKVELSETQHSTLIAWLQKMSSHADASNYALTTGIRFCPEAVRENALHWIRTRPRDFQTHYLMVVWLKQGLPIELIAPFVEQWAIRFSNLPHLSFIVRAWLEAGGDKEILRVPIKTWLALHATDVEARFVYQPWLDAGGEIDLVRNSIGAWLALHATDVEAGFVYRAWLDAGGDIRLVQAPMVTWLIEHKDSEGADFLYKGWLNAGGDRDLIRESLVSWLEKYGTSAEADFVYRAWLQKGGDFLLIKEHAIQWMGQNYDREEAVFLAKELARQDDIPVETVKNILTWCRKFPRNEDALWRLAQLKRHFLREGVLEEVIATSELLLEARLAPGERLSSTIKEQITALFSHLIDASKSCPEQLRSGADALFIRWLRYPASFGDRLNLHYNFQRRNYIQRIADLLDSGDLNVVEDREALERFLRWINNWEPERKLNVHPIIRILERKYPAPGLWDIVKFD
jgi:hypothetical protein